jgi:hypothetical protein
MARAKKNPEVVTEEVAASEVASDTRIHKSTGVEKPTKLVWEIADSMPGAKRKDVLAALEAKGIAYYTARTQYQKWLVNKRAKKAAEA